MTSLSVRGSGRRYVLDANALIGFFEGRRRTAEKVHQLLGEALRQDLPLLMSAVNWGEVFYIAWRRHGEDKAREAEARLQEMPIAVIGVDRGRASRAAAVKQRHGLGYADAFAAELAMEQNAWLVTADSEFSKVGNGLSIYPLPRHEK
jgi:predicted nucleic acid-binding protein